MTVDEALKNLDDACSTIQANRQVHVILQESIITLQKALAKNGKEKVDSEGDKEAGGVTPSTGGSTGEEDSEE